jgi:hypothetical protein
MLEGFAVQGFINQSEHDGSIAVESPYNSDGLFLRISHQKEHLFRVSGRVMRLLTQFMPKGMAIPS